MKSTFISKEGNDAKFTMEFPWEEFNAAIIKVYQATKDRFVVDGFRRGKAPRSIIERFYGEGVFFEDAINDMFYVNYPKALDELKLVPVAQPRVEFSQIKKGEDLTITVTVETYPEFEVKDYKGVEVEKEVHAVTEEQVDNDLEQLRQRNARLVSVERGAKDGDSVLLDYKGFVGDEQFAGGTAEGYTLKLGSGTFIPGFEEQLIGVKPGEDKDVVVTFPEEYHSEELAGKEAVFKCTVHEIKEQQLDELNDDFAMDVSEFDTMAELREDTRKKLEKQAEELADAQAKNDALEAVYDANDIPVPGAIVDEETDRAIRDFEQNLAYQGLSLNNYYEFMHTTAADFRANMKPDAERRVKMRMILEKIAEQEKIEVSEEELSEKLKEMAAMYGMEEAQVREALGEGGIDSVMDDIKAEKASNVIFDNMKTKAPKAKKASTKKEEDKDGEEKKPAKKATAKKESAKKEDPEEAEEKPAKKPAAKKTAAKKKEEE